MNDTSWFKMYRRILNWSWFTDSKTLHVFIYLLARANVAPAEFHGRMIQRGQVVTSYSSIAEATGMSVSSARRAIDNLRFTGEIKSVPTNRYNLITIMKYEHYQDKYHDYEQAKEQANEQTKEHRNKKNNRRRKEKETAPAKQTGEDNKPAEKYVLQYWEKDIPKKYYGRFSNEDEWWQYVEQNRAEVEAEVEKENEL